MKIFSPKKWFKREPVVAVLRLSGAIGLASPLRPGLSLAGLAGLLEKAFTLKGVKAVALAINSPGGSPVQSTLIHDRIRALASENDVPVYAFAEDVAASGGYMLALGADHIYADASSVIGSIGVISAGFGFDRMIDKLGVDRRVHTAGKRKMTLDPFQPENPDDIRRLKALQKDVHQTFKDLVVARRGERIVDNGKDLFTGEFWSGNQAMELGLVDGIADLRTKMRELFGDDINLKVISPRRRLFQRLGAMSSGREFGDLGSYLNHSLADDFIAAVEIRALWSRFGL